MRLRTFLRFLFVEYCVVIGLLLLLLPWSDAWPQVFRQIPQSAVSDLLRNSFVRSAISAFGLVHLLWVLHDVDLFLTQLRQRAEESTEPNTSLAQDEESLDRPAVDASPAGDQ